MPRQTRSQRGVSETGNKILGRADFDQPFGVLQQFIEQVNGIQSSPITAAVQTALASRVSNEFRMFGNQFRERHPEMSVADMFRDRDAVNHIMNSPLSDMQSLLDTQVGNQTMGQKYPDLAHTYTVGEGIWTLLRGNIGGIRKQMQDLGIEQLDHGGVNPGIADYFHTAFSAFYDNTPLFDDTRGTSFTKFIQEKMYFAVHGVKERETEDHEYTQSINKENGPSEETFQNPFLYEGDIDYGNDPLDENPSELSTTSLLDSDRYSDYDLDRDLIEAGGESLPDAVAPDYMFPNSMAARAGVPPGTRFNFSGKSEDQFEAILAAIAAGKPIGMKAKDGTVYHMDPKGADFYPVNRTSRVPTSKRYEKQIDPAYPNISLTAGFRGGEVNDYIPGLQGQSAIETWEYLTMGWGRKNYQLPGSVSGPVNTPTEPVADVLSRALPTSETTMQISSIGPSSGPVYGPVALLPDGRLPHGTKDDRLPYFSTYDPPVAKSSLPSFSGPGTKGEYPQSSINGPTEVSTFGGRSLDPGSRRSVAFNTMVNSIMGVDGGSGENPSSDQLPPYVAGEPKQFADNISRRMRAGDARGRAAARQDYLDAGGVIVSTPSRKEYVNADGVVAPIPDARDNPASHEGVPDIDYANRFDPVEKYPLLDEPDEDIPIPLDRKTKAAKALFEAEGGSIKIAGYTTPIIGEPDGTRIRRWGEEGEYKVPRPSAYIDPLANEGSGHYTSLFDYKRTHQTSHFAKNANYSRKMLGGFRREKYDAVLANRDEFDEKQEAYKKLNRAQDREAADGKDPIDAGSISDGYQDHIEGLAYQDAIMSIRAIANEDIDQGDASEQIAVNGSLHGWNVQAVSLISQQELDRSKVDQRAMVQATSYRTIQITHATPTSGDPNLDVSIQEGNQEGMPVEILADNGTHNDKKPKAVRRNMHASGVGNLPNIHGGAGRATPEPQRRHSADGDFVEPQMQNILGNSARAANPTGRTERNDLYTYDHASDEDLDRIRTQAMHYNEYRDDGRNYAFSFYYPEGDEVTKNHIFAAAMAQFHAAGTPFGDIEEFTGDDGYSGVRFNLPEGVTPTNRTRAASDGAANIPGNESETPNDTSDDPFSADWMGQDPGVQNGGPSHTAGGGAGGPPNRRPPVNGGGSGGPADPGTPRRPNQRTPQPNRAMRDALNMGSRRAPNFNPSTNPLEAGTRSFGRSMGRHFSAWNEATGDNPDEFAINSSEMFKNYLYAESDGTGDQYIEENVPEGVRGEFRNAAQAGAETFMGAAGFARAASPQGVADYFSRGSRDRAHGGSDGGLAAHYENPMVGHAEQERVTNDAGEVIGSRTHIVKDGREVLSADQVDSATEIAQTAISGATNRALPSEPGSAMATIKANISAIVEEHVKAIGDAVRKTGASEDTVQTISKSIKDLALDETNRWVKVASTGLDGAQRNGAPGAGDASDVQHLAGKPTDMADFQKVMNEHPKIKAQVDKYASDNGTTPERMMNAPESEATYFEDGNLSYKMGGYGTPRGEDGGGGGNNKPSMWRGKIGTAMYAAYIGTRMWNMGMGETMQSAATYGNYASGIGNIAGGGTGILGTDSGFAARQSIGQIYEGRGAEQEFGSFMNSSFYMGAGGDDSSSRLWASAKAGATSAAEISIGGTLLAGLPGVAEGAAGLGGVMAGVAGALPAAGLAIGVGMIGGTGLMELYNKSHPDQSAMSWSSVYSGTINSGWLSEASQKYYADHPNQKSATYGLESFARGALNALDPVLGMAVDTALPSGDTRKLTQDQIRPYLTDAQYGSMFPMKNADVEASIKASDAFMPFGLTADAAKTATQALFSAQGSVPTTDEIAQYGPSVQLYGTQAISDASQYAHDMGYTTGTADYSTQMGVFNSISGADNRDNALQEASRTAQIASQVSPYMVPTQWGAANKVAKNFGLDTQPKAASWQRFNQTISNYQAGAVTATQMTNTGMFASSATPLQTQFISQIGDMAGQAGKDVSAAMGIAWSANLNPQQQAAATSVANGDFRASSAYASQGLLGSKYSLYDQSGNPMSETNGAGFLAAASQWDTGFSWQNSTSATSMAAAFTGNNGADVASAFANGGTRGIQDLSIASANSYRAAAAGIQMAGIMQQETYLWGSGSWSNPSENSAWGLQNQQVAQQYSFQQADFNYTQQSMNLSNKYAVQNENNQGQRMALSQSNNLYNMDFNRMQSLEQRSWTQQDYQYQDTQRSENYAWSMQDINEDIRFAGGRQRRDLIRQRDREALTNSQDTAQIDTTRDRQAEVWAQEDDHFAKEKAYTLELNDLDKQSYNSQRQQRLDTYAMEEANLARKRKEFDESQALELQVRNLDRDNQAKSLANQMASASLSAQQANDQARYQAASLAVDRNVTDFMGKLQTSANYDAVNHFGDALDALVTTVNKTDTNKINQIIYLIQQLVGG